MLDDYGMNFVINTGNLLVSLDCLNTLIMIKSATENVIPDVLGQEQLPSSIQVETAIRTTCHIVIKALVKFILVAHGGHV